MNKFRRNCLIISLVCFAIAGLCLFALVDECMAGDFTDDLELIKNSNGHYVRMKHDGSAHVYWATYDISFNHGSIKVKGTHGDLFMRPENRPAKHDDKGNLTKEWLIWLSKLNYTHMTEKGEKLWLLSNSGLDKVHTEKSGKYYIYVWSSDEVHDRYVAWCKKNGIELNH